MYKPGSLFPRVSVASTSPAPTGGLNDFDPIAAMGDEFMLDCMNIYPDTSDIISRPGYAPLQMSVGGPVCDIFAHITTSGDYQIFATTQSGIYDVTVPGTVTKVFDLTSGITGHVNFTNADNAYTIVWNGVDPAVLYDGTEWKSFVEVTTPSAPGQISGLDPAKISWAFAYKARLWFVKKNSMEMFFLPLDAVGGAASPMPIGGNFNRGGYLVALGGWSTNTGAGLSARLLAITSEGEVASFSGSDPSDASNWGLDSVFYVSQPLGPYAYTTIGGDLAIMTRRGLVPVSSMMSGVPSEVMFANAMTKRISNAIKRLTVSWQSLPYPIQVFNHPEIQWLTINVYDESLDKPVQYVMNIISGAWGRFDYPARVVKTYDNVTYIGTDDGKIYTVNPGSFVDYPDNESDGEQIQLKVTSAYSYLGAPTINKHAKLIRPVIRSRSKPAFNMRVLSDFRREDYDPYIVPTPAFNDPIWDEAIWDEARWGGANEIHLPWLSANELGYAFSWQLKASTGVEFRLSAIEWVYEAGGLV